MQFTAKHLKMARSWILQRFYLLVILGLIAGIWISIAWALRVNRSNIYDLSLRENANLVSLYAEELKSELRLVNSVLRALAYYWGSLESHAEFDDLVLAQKEIAGDLSDFGITIVDRNGNLVYTSFSKNFAHINVSDRKYFTMQLDPASDDDLYMSGTLRNRITGEWAIVLTRRLNTDSGAFAGVIGMTVPPEHFLRFSRTVDLGKGGAIAITRNDGELIARWPRDDKNLGEEIHVSPVTIRDFESDKIDIKLFERKSIADGVTRLYASKQLPDYDTGVQIGKYSSRIGTRGKAT